MFNFQQRQEIFRFSKIWHLVPGVYLASYSMGTGVFFPGANWPGHEADHSILNPLLNVAHVKVFYFNSNGLGQYQSWY